jgi:TetR/AcrR family transcriptional regulator, fatty acid metabolism regulator protein
MSLIDTAHDADPTAGARRREQIIDAAIGVIDATGVGSASVGAIAAWVGVSKGVVAYHYPSKDALLSAVASAVYDRARTAMASVLDNPTPRAALVRYIRSNLQWITHNPADVSALIALRAAGPEPVVAHAAALDAVARDELARLFAAAHGTPTPEAAHALALRGAIDAYAITSRRQPPPDPDQYAAVLIATFVGEAR